MQASPGSHACLLLTHWTPNPASHSFQPPASPWLLLAGSLLGNVPESHLHKQPRARSVPQLWEIEGAVGTFPPKAKAVCRMGCELLFQEISSCLQEGDWREGKSEGEREEREGGGGRECGGSWSQTSLLPFMLVTQVAQVSLRSATVGSLVPLCEYLSSVIAFPLKTALPSLADGDIPLAYGRFFKTHPKVCLLWRSLGKTMCVLEKVCWSHLA